MNGRERITVKRSARKKRNKETEKGGPEMRGKPISGCVGYYE